MFWLWRGVQSVWQRACMAWEHARLVAENQRAAQELREEYGGGPIPFTRAEIERMREIQKHFPPERRKEYGCLDLDKEVIEVDEESLEKERAARSRR